MTTKSFDSEYLQQLLEDPGVVLTQERGAMQMFVAGTLHTARTADAMNRAADALERIAHALESEEIALLDRGDLVSAIRSLKHGTSY